MSASHNPPPNRELEFSPFLDHDVNQTIQERFRQQVVKFPDRIAVTDFDESVTYVELEKHSNAIANHLRLARIVPDRPVGILMGHHSQVIASMLGILKAGSFYIPLDPKQPEIRLKEIVSFTDVQLIITDREEMTEESIGSSCRLLKVQQLDTTLEREDSGIEVGSSSLCFLMPTSGSTGKPKVVKRIHRNVLRNTQHFTNGLKISAKDRVALLASCHFAASVSDIYGTLMNGATLCLYDIRRLGIIALADWLSSQRVTVYHSVPTVFRSLMSTLNQSQSFPDVRLIKLGGEAVLASDFSLFQKHFSENCLFSVGYGATESNIICQGFFQQSDSPASRVLPVGSPPPGVEIQVRDETGSILPRGETGRIHVVSDHFSIGYWHDDDLTKATYLEEEIDSDRRVFRTSDLGRVDETGVVHLMARVETMAKIRGHRVEFGEIESELSNHPAVSQAVVKAWQKTETESKLVAYYIKDRENDATDSELIQFLRESIPDYMVPSVLVEVDDFPVTATGKVDRKAIPEPSSHQITLDSEFVAPRTELEKQLACIWCDVLDVQRVGIHDSFIDLGGDSLLVTQIVLRIQAEFEIELSMHDVFEKRTIEDVASYIQLLQSSNDQSSYSSIRRVSRKIGDSHELSYSQKRLWYLEQLDADQTAYNIVSVFELNGSLDVESLRRSFEEVVRRHEPLRTVFGLRDKQPVQIVKEPSRFELQIREFPPDHADLRLEIDHTCELETEKPFDLTQDLMVRVSLLRTDSENHLLFLTMHHIASDGWSMRLLWKELGQIYRNIRTGHETQLPKLPIQHIDFAVWQTEQEEKLQRDLTYWVNCLAGLETLNLPTDFPRPQRMTYRGNEQRFHLDLERVKYLEELAKAEQTTLHAVLLAAFLILMMRYANQKDISVGVPVNGRVHPQTKDLIGFFVNTLVIRCDLSGNPTLREAIGRVRSQTIAAMDHQECPFERIVEELSKERQLDRTPLFQVLFQLLAYSDEDYQLDDVEVERIRPKARRSRFDIEFHLRQRSNGIDGSIVFNSDLYESSTIQRLADHFIIIVDAMIACPEMNIGQVPILTGQEQQLLESFNATERTWLEENRIVHRLVEQQAERTPDSIAVQFENEGVTYQDLNRRANQLAHHLVDRGVRVGDHVGIYMERSVALVVGLLGCLKSGAAYVPLDLSSPPQRLGSIIADAQLELIVSQDALKDHLLETESSVSCLTVEELTISESSPEHMTVDVAASDLCYIMYTSGSTGSPKGVQQTHFGLANLIHWQSSDPNLGVPAKTLQYAPVAFDVSFQEIFTTLCSGGTLYLIQEELRVDFNELWSFIENSQIERLFLPFVALQQLALVAKGSATLKDVISAGERLLLTPEIQAFAKNSSFRLHNHYGPTETHVVTSHRLPNTPDDWPDESPIGTPIANTKAHVVNEFGVPQPIGVWGELSISGDGLARGYLKDPGLTGGKFDDVSGERSYQTGDQCRWRSDGVLEFSGRMDDQIKIRGYRIELGEIESVLSDHPELSQSVVVFQEDQQRLVGFYQQTANPQLKSTGIRNFLKDRIPEYMIPSLFIHLEEFPVAATGKVDRLALARTPTDNALTYPAIESIDSPTERKLKAIWREILAVDQIGKNEDFFEIGGHSLLTVQLFIRIEEEFGIKLPLATIFQNRIVTQLADVIDNQSCETGIAEIVPLQPNGTLNPLFIMPSIGGELLFANRIIDCLGTDIPVFGVQPSLSPGNIDHFRDFRATATAFARKIQAFTSGPYSIVGYSYGALMAYEVACVLSELGENVSLVFAIDSGPGFRGKQLNFAMKMNRILRVLINFPGWMKEEMKTFSTRRLYGSLHRKVRWFIRRRFSAEVLKPEIDDVFNIDHIPSQNIELMKTVFAAFRDYIPSRFRGKVVLARAKVDPLFSGRPDDIGWGELVNDLEIHHVDGNHESILAQPSVQRLSDALKNAHTSPF